MALSKKPYKGTRDFFPADKRVQDYLFEVMRRTAKSFGFEPYDGPLLEEVELYKAKSGEELINDQIYDFTDRGKRHVAIRPEMTPTVARMVAQVHRETPKPIRWFSIPNLYRYERPQRGRLREHWQFNVDIFGAPAEKGEREILQLLITLLKNFGATEKEFRVYVNHREIVDDLCSEVFKVQGETAYQLYKVIDQSKKLKPEALSEKIQALKLPAPELFQEYLALENLAELEDFLKKQKLLEKHAAFFQFINDLKELDLDRYISFDPAIVRGLDYYTGLVFEVFDLHPDNRRAICGGGAYANLLQIFNESPLPGVGFGLGDVTLTDFLKTHQLLPNFEKPENDFFLSFQTDKAELSIQKLAQALRDKGYQVITHLESLKLPKAFKLSEQKGAHVVGLLGEDEWKEKKISLKKLASKEQESFSLDEVEKMLNFYHR
jgi:histidyl-tRNA synthetase